MSLTNWYKCGHCDYEGECYGNGFSCPWCRLCGRNDKLVRIPHPARWVNGNEHLANMEVFRYDALTIVTEAPDESTVRVTVYKGDEPVPIHVGLYGFSPEEE